MGIVAEIQGPGAVGAGQIAQGAGNAVGRIGTGCVRFPIKITDHAAIGAILNLELYHVISVPIDAAVGLIVTEAPSRAGGNGIAIYYVSVSVEARRRGGRWK